MTRPFLTAIKIMLLGFIVLMPFSNRAMADSGARFEEKAVDGYRVKLGLASGGAQVGHNKLNIQIIDAKGAPINDTSITVIAEYFKEAVTSTSDHGMGMGTEGKDTKSTPAEVAIRTVKAVFKAGHEAGEYEGEVELDEAGHWMVKVVFLQQQEKSAAFEVEVSAPKSGPNWFVLMGFAGIIAVLITTAAVTKSRNTKKPVPEEVK